MSKRLTTQEFILKSNIKHDYKYNYSNTEYINDKSLVSIICKKHGIFQQLPNVHYRSGCPKCGLLKRSNSRKNDFSELLDNYEYDNIEKILKFELCQ